MSRYARFARREHGEATRIATTAMAGPVFLGLLPFVVMGIGPRLDRRLGLPRPSVALGRRVAGGLLAIAGYALALWSIDAQLSRGRGTPLPVMPTQELLTDGPFRYCRNPMTLGTILAYLGLAIARGTVSGMVLVLSFGASLVAYLKRLEEDELVERFGEAYVVYRDTTPFMIPRLRR
jgi:protein-S-isoprenylcysteine O-methyltransferase Ste14